MVWIGQRKKSVKGSKEWIGQRRVAQGEAKNSTTPVDLLQQDPDMEWTLDRAESRGVWEIIIINLLTARVVGTPQMISQPISSIFSLFSTALWDLVNSRPVHTLMLSSYLFLHLPCLLPPFTVPWKMVLTRPDEQETCPYHCRRYFEYVSFWSVEPCCKLLCMCDAESCTEWSMKREYSHVPVISEENTQVTGSTLKGLAFSKHVLFIRQESSK